jgi:hypothetical protein
MLLERVLSKLEVLLMCHRYEVASQQNHCTNEALMMRSWVEVRSDERGVIGQPCQPRLDLPCGWTLNVRLPKKP